MSKELEEKLLDQLKNDVDEASWAMLEPHHKRGAVFIVKDIELEQAGAAVALDDSAKVKIWLDNGNLTKVEDNLAQDFAKELHAKNFDFVIVQPYVFIKARK